MTTLRREHFDEPLKKYEQRDPELFRELHEKLSPPSEEKVAHAMRTMNLVTEAPLVSASGAATEHGRRVAENDRSAECSARDVDS